MNLKQSFPITRPDASWLFALGLMLVSFLLNLWIHAITGNRVPFLPFYPAIIIIGFCSGAGPGAVALVGAVFCVGYLWLAPLSSGHAAAADAAILVPFAIGAGMGLAVAAIARRLLLESRATRDQLDAALQFARDAEHRFQIALKGGAIIVWACDAHKRYTWIYNPATDLNSSDFVGRTLDEVVARDRYPQFADAVDRVLLTGRSERVPVTFEHNGQLRHYLASIDPVLGEDGEVVGLIGASMDTTELHQAEQAVRTSEKQLRTISDALPVLVALIDQNHIYRFNNAAYERWHAGRPRDQITHHHVREVLGDATYQAIRPDLQRALYGETLHFDTRVDFGIGPRDVLITYIPQRDQQQITGVVVLVEDISVRKRTEVALRDKEQRWRTMFDAQPECITVVAADGALIDINPAGLAMIEAGSLHQVQGMNMRSLIDPKHWSQFQQLHAAALGGQGLSEPREFDLIGLSGTRRTMESRSVPLRDGNGEVNSVLSVTQDVTARKRAERALREADQRKDEFLATLAHELRNPMAPIRYAAATLKPEAADSTIQRAREVIERQSAQMSRLLDDLLDMSRITRNVVELQRATLDLRALLTEAVEMAKPVLNSLQHRLTVSTPPNALFVYGDATRLLQVMGNLIDNAAKYTEPGGSIEIRLESEIGQAVLRVIDTGIGLTPEMMPKVFDLFTQVHKGAKIAKGGLGIGLAVVKRLVELHGGTIQVRSDGLNRGAQFTVRLPLSAGAAGAIPQRENVVPLYRAHPPLLIVDDNRDAADSLAFMLRGEGFQVLVAYDGGGALSAFDRFVPSVVLLDMGLPDMHGTEVARQIRAHAGGRSAQIIAVTGWGQDQDRERSRSAGVDLHLVKPVDPDTLLRVLQQRPGVDSNSALRSHADQ